MKLLRGHQNLNALKRASIATIGNFDGFHLGHQKIIRHLIEEAKTDNLGSVLISFEPTAKEFFAGDKAPARIYPLRKKIQLASTFGLDYLSCLKFNKALASMPAADFVKDILYDALHVRKLIVGDDFKFGYQRQGDIHLLRTMGTELGFEVEDIATILHDTDRVSSSLIRENLANGNFQKAAELLGRRFTIGGRVFHGDKKGRTIGFPTANILLRRRVSPVNGVFTVTAKHKTQSWQGVANVGKRPTVNGQRLQLEVHLFDCQENLYGEHLDVIFHSKLRDEIKFPSFDELKQQITLDAQSAQQYFSERT